MIGDTTELDAAQLERLWAELGIPDGEAETVYATIVPPKAAASLQAPLGDADLGPFESGEVDLTGPIASGGMAIVHTAHQRSLDREVAVKVLRPEVSNPRTRSQLLREARLTGALEHPNIIPVHTIGVTPDGEPLLVMKRVDGVSWRTFIDTPDDRADAFSGETPLEKNLEILMQVAKAVRYAHTRGVVHRDLKPENVMIGWFGDVYLLDWGIALRLTAGTAQVDHVAGTPGYMAPEMVAMDKSPITAQTDVYLLGAVLHELLMGEPPHQSKTVHAALFKAYRSEPEAYPPEVFAELAAICNTAMARDPADRFQSASEFRRALVEYLRHGGSIAAANEAAAQLAQLEAVLDAPETDPGLVHRHYGAARFGFEHALGIWPENVAARAGLQAVLERMIGFELDLRHPTVAQALYAELPEAEPTLKLRLAEAHAEEIARTVELAALRALERDFAPEVGAQTRSRVAVGLATVLGALAMGSGAFVRNVLPEGIRPWHYIAHGLLLVLVAVLFIFSNRRALLSNGLNRRISTMTLLMIIGGLMFRVGVAVTGQPYLPLLPLEFVLYGTSIGLMGFATHRRLAIAAVPAFVGALAMALEPRWNFEIAGMTVFASLAMMGVIWARDGRDTGLDDLLSAPGTRPG